MHRHTKFDQNGQNGCRYIAFNVFFKMAAIRHLGFFKIDFLNIPYGSEGQYVSPCKISSKSVEPLVEYSNLSIFSLWRPSAILYLWGKFWDDPQRTFDGLYHCAKFGCNRICRFNNTMDQLQSLLTINSIACYHLLCHVASSVFVYFM